MAGCRALTTDEVNEIAGSFYGRHAIRNRAMFILGINTGFRISELLSIRIADVWDGQDVKKFVRVNKSHMKGKRNGREIPLNDKARNAVREWITQAGDVAPDTPLFFSQVNPKQPFNRQRAHAILKEVFNDCHLDGTLATHTMRKTFAESVRKASGNDIFTVSRMLGHTDIATTQKYLDVTTEQQWQIINAL